MANHCPRLPLVAVKVYVCPMERFLTGEVKKLLPPVPPELQNLLFDATVANVKAVILSAPEQLPWGCEEIVHCAPALFTGNKKTIEKRILANTLPHVLLQLKFD